MSFKSVLILTRHVDRMFKTLIMEACSIKRRSEMSDEYEQYIDDEIAALAEEWELWNDQQCEFDGE